MPPLGLYIAFLGACAVLCVSPGPNFGRVDRASVPATPRHASLMLHGFLTGVANPKLLVFFAAFLPQFIAEDRPALSQLVVLSVTFMLLIFIGDGIWIVGANRLRRFASDARMTQRFAGALMVSAGAGLALVRRS